MSKSKSKAPSREAKADLKYAPDGKKLFRDKVD
jgi:hypothetical protein